MCAERVDVLSAAIRGSSAARGAGLLRRRQRRRSQRLVKIGKDIVNVLDADREAHVARRHAARQLIGRAQLRVRGAGRMDGQRAHITDVGHVIEELQRIDETRSSLAALLELEADETTIAPEIRVARRRCSGSSCRPA